MAAAAHVPPRSSPARPLGSSQQEDKEGSQKINTRPGKVPGGPGWVGRPGLGTVWQHFPRRVTPSLPSPDHPVLRCRLRGAQTGHLGRRPRRHVLGALAHHLHPSHPRRVGTAAGRGHRGRDWRGLARSPCRGCRSPASRSDRPAAAHYRGRSTAAVAARPRPRSAPG